MEFKLINVQETTKLDLKISTNLESLSSLIENITIYEQFSYDFSSNVLTITIQGSAQIIDLSTIGEVIE